MLTRSFWFTFSDLRTGAMSCMSPCRASFWKTSFSLLKTSWIVPPAALASSTVWRLPVAFSTCTLILGCSWVKRGSASLTHSPRAPLVQSVR